MKPFVDLKKEQHNSRAQLNKAKLQENRISFKLQNHS